MIKKIAAFISTIGPGIFLIGYNIGTGSVTTMAVSGSSYGMTLIWPLLLSCLFTFTDGFLYFADAVNRDNLRFNLDTSNQFFLQDNIFLSLIRLSERIDYIHISDNPGGRIAHWVPGSGVIDWELFFETLDKISYKGYIGLDIGGEESPIDQIGKAYSQTASWVNSHYSPNAK